MVIYSFQWFSNGFIADLKIELSENLIPDFLRYLSVKSHYQQAENGSQEVTPRRFFRPSIDQF